MSRFAVRFVTEKGQPVNRPMWVKDGARPNHDFGSYTGPFWMVTDQPEQAATYAKRETAERWVERLYGETADGTVLYGFEVEEMP